MAGASDKKQAASNLKVLKEIHLASLIVNSVTLFFLFVLHRPTNKKTYFLLSLPAFICQYVIETTGRPKFTTNGQGYQILVKSGEDLQQSGLTEYMFDIIYVTLLLDVLMILFGSNKVWILYLAIPGFAAFKMKWLLSSVLGLARGKGLSGGSNDKPANGDVDNEPVKSKRQAKLEARGKKQKVRYR